MLFQLPFVLSSALLIIGSVVASPTSYPRVKTLSQELDIISPVVSNTSLGYTRADGPGDFDCIVTGRVDLPIPRKHMYALVMKMLIDIAPADFNSPLDEGFVHWLGPNHLAIMVTSVDLDRPMGRRFLMWAITRILYTMNRDPKIGFYMTNFEARWKGTKIGTIDVGFTQLPSIQTGGTSTTIGLSTAKKASSNITTLNNNYGSLSTTALTNQGQVYYGFHPRDVLMDLDNAAMGITGAIISAAEHTESTFDIFVGGLKGYTRTRCGFQAVSPPSRLTKTILVSSLVATALWMIKEDDYHAVDVKVYIDVDQIARGRCDL